MKHPVKTLAALAILGVVAPSAQAVSIKDDVLSITPTVRIQTRAQMSDATGATGNEYRVQGGIDDSVNDPIDFSIRRARLGMNFKYGANWKGQLTLQADGVDTRGGSMSGSSGTVGNTNGQGANRLVQIRYAWLERGFDQGDGMTHAINFGLQKPGSINPSDKLSSSVKFLPNDNAASGFLAPRGVGLGYRFEHPVFLIAADLQNNSVAHNTTAASDALGEEEGFCYGVRAEFSFSPDWFIKKRAESFVGKEGQGLNIGVSYGTNQDGVNAATTTQTIDAYGVDVMFWLNGLSAYAEYRAGTTEVETIATGATTETDTEIIVLQAGFALPIDEYMIEPVVRYQMIDGNTDADEASVFGDNAETGGSGTQIDVGVNLYLAGHDNKLSLAVSLWEAEAGDGDATIVRLQHQINF